MTTIYLDGAFGEGGGQIIRTSASLAAITGRTVEIANIRTRRSKPGLQAQHLTSVRAAGALCHATLHGDTLGSQFLRFVPNGRVETSRFTFDVAEARGGASAGATGLVAQTIMVPLAAMGYEHPEATIAGGTHVPMSPPADYIEAVYVPTLRRLGFDFTFLYDRAGFFPKGGGELRLTGNGAEPLETPLDLTERGKLRRLRVFVVTSQLPDHVFERARDTVFKPLKGYGVSVEIENRSLPSHGAGAAVVVVAECENGMGGWTSLGERGKPMERVAEDAVRGFQKWFGTGAATDEHLADQLVLPCALVPGEHRWTTSEVTEHLRTVLHVAQSFLPIEYEIKEAADGMGSVTLRGAEAFSIR